MLENSLLIIVFLEVYLSVVDFFHGKGRSVVYIMDATLSFVLREIIIGILTGSVTYIDLLAMSGAIGIIASGRFLLASRNLRLIRRRKVNKERSK
ncbi:MAG: phosphate-starvation-inducible PsiE family protein [Acidianus infernus]|nr:phosphate-starvation-inducible PsiE family protein [Acidianus infernus]